MNNELDCQIAEIIDSRGMLHCFNYAIEKCRALADALECQTKDLATSAAEAQAALLLVQMIIASRIGLDCVTDKLKETVNELHKDAETCKTATLAAGK